MAILRVPEENRTLLESQDISEYLVQFGIWYSKYEGGDDLSEDASDDEILQAYAAPIETLKEKGGYITADVINIHPGLEGLDNMLNKFNREHWHDEDEVRFIVKGSGLFHIHPNDQTVFSIELFAGDMINVPAGFKHWFDLCADKTIQAIRLFKDTQGWTPHYTETGVETNFQPLCFGPTYLPQTGISSF